MYSPSEPAGVGKCSLVNHVSNAHMFQFEDQETFLRKPSWRQFDVVEVQLFVIDAIPGAITISVGWQITWCETNPPPPLYDVYRPSSYLFEVLKCTWDVPLENELNKSYEYIRYTLRAWHALKSIGRRKWLTRCTPSPPAIRLSNW